MQGRLLVAERRKPNGTRVVQSEVAVRRKPPGFCGLFSRVTGRLAPFRYNSGAIGRKPPGFAREGALKPDGLRRLAPCRYRHA